jgi:hypothetical protein
MANNVLIALATAANVVPPAVTLVPLILNVAAPFNVGLTAVPVIVGQLLNQS